MGGNKIKIFILFLIAALGLSGCNKNEKQPISKSIVPSIKIGVLLYKQEDTFISSIYSYFEQAAKKLEQENNMKITIKCLDGKGSQSVQNDQVDTLLEQDFDVLCINLVDRTAAATIIDKAKTVDIPIIFFNRELVKEDLDRWEKTYYVGANSNESGVMQGEIVAEKFLNNPEIYDKNGDGKLQYVMLEGEYGHQDALIRTEYSIKTIVSNGIIVEKLANDTANWQRSQANTKTSQWIETFGEKIEAVIANNDDMAMGALDAYIEEEISSIPIIVGIDGISGTIEAVKNGLISGTVKNDSKKQAEAILEICYELKFYNDKNTDSSILKNKYVRIPYKLITSENVDTYIEE